jgi:GWxTD domain-containing protein
MRYVFVMCVFLLTAGWAADSPAQMDMSKQPEYQAPAPFSVDVFSFKADSGKSRLDLYLRIYNNMLTFVKQDGQFIANYEVVVDFFDTDEKGDDPQLLLEKTWSQAVAAPTYEISVSSNRYHETARSYEIPLAVRLVSVQVRDKSSDKTFVIKRQIQASPVDGDGLGMSSVMLVGEQRRDEQGKKIIAPNLPALIFLKDGQKPVLYYELYSAVKDREQVWVNYAVTSRGRNEALVDTFTRPVRLAGEKTEVFAEIPIDKLIGGDYLVTLTVKDKEDGQALAGGVAIFRVRLLGLAAGIPNMMEAIEQLRYVADSKEIDKILKGKTDEEKLQRFNDYWRKRDPTPGTEENELMAEYYDRIRYANQHFTNYMDGWRTDMGMIYIKYGAPDFVERGPYDFNTRPYEIWQYYNHRRRFVFVDMSGFGDYRLAIPEWDVRNRTQ